MDITVAIASAGRPAILHETVPGLGTQFEQTRHVLISVASMGDVLAETLDLPAVQMVRGQRGLTLQRNTSIDNLAADADAHYKKPHHERSRRNCFPPG